jgi:hypothetical protein
VLAASFVDGASTERREEEGGSTRCDGDAVLSHYCLAYGKVCNTEGA